MITLKVGLKQHDNNISLSWKDTSGGNSSYKILRRKVSNSIGSNITQEEFKPVSVFNIEDTVDGISILNIHPNCGNKIKYEDYLGQEKEIRESQILQKWMEEPSSEAPAGYGLGRMTIRSCAISEFNLSPQLFYSNGTPIYDAICIGFYDDASISNINEQFTTASIKEIKNFIEEGYGVLVGHDFLSGTFGTKKGLGTIRDLFGITLGQFNSTNSFDHSFNAKFEGSKIQINKSGSLMLYPWAVGTLEDDFDIAPTHTTSQYCHGDIWLSFKDPKITGEAYLNDTFKRIGNSYLTTYNSTALIQIGNTLDIKDSEKKILANTLFFLKQNTTKKVFIDTDYIDDEKPIQPTIIKYFIDEEQSSITFDYRCEDVGTTFEYYVESNNKKDGTREKSNIVKASFTSGLDVYKYKLKQIESDIIKAIDDFEETKDKTLTIYNIHSGYYSFQIYAVDKCLNKSDIKEIIFYMPGIIKSEKSPAITKYPNVQRVNNRYRGPHESKKANNSYVQIKHNLINLSNIIEDLEKEKDIMIQRPSVDYVSVEENKKLIKNIIKYIRKTNARVNEPNIK